MKKLVFLLAISYFAASAQTTATNFSSNDCNSVPHELFTELDAGKVVVLIWVMPCGACIDEAQMVQTEVVNALNNHPGKVLYYLADDYGTTNCASLKNWVNTNGITNAVVFTNSAIKMSDYGANGMPKVIVVGGTAHKVYYNQIAPNITANEVRDAIDLALSESNTNTGIGSQTLSSMKIVLYPIPGSSHLKMEVGLPAEARVKTEVINEIGQVVKSVDAGILPPGVNTLSLDIEDLAKGNYYISVSDGESLRTERLLIAR